MTRHALICLLASSSAAFSQQTPAAHAPVSPAVAASAVVAVPATPAAAPVPDANGKYMLHEGTNVNLAFAEDLTSKTAAEGDPVTLTLSDNLMVGNIIVAKAGSKAFGEVTKAKKAGMMGAAGDLSIRLNYLKTADGKIMLRGTKGKEGESGLTGAVVLTVLFGPIGLIKHGHNVEIKTGQTIHAFVADDVALVPLS